MPTLTALPSHATGDVFPASDWNTYLQANLNYIVQAGADLAALAGSNTLAVTNEFHRVTLAGGSTIDNLDILTVVPVKGQQYRLELVNAQTIRNNGAGTGNIRTRTGADLAVGAGTVVTFTWNGTFFRATTASDAIAAIKTTAKVVSATVTETDLLNAEFTLAAGVLGTGRTMRLTAWGDAVYTAGAVQAPPRFKFKVGAGPTVILDTSTTAAQFNTSATRYAWRITIEWTNLGVTNSQWATFEARVAANVAAATSAVFATGEGSYNLTPSGVGGVAILAGGGASAIDTTVAQAIILSVINGSATTTDVTLKAAIMEILG